MLAGDPPDSGQTAGPVTDTDPAVLGREQTRIRDKVVIVRAGANPAAQAAAAAAVGARAVLLADPRERPLPGDPRRPRRRAGGRRHRRGRRAAC